MTSTAILFATAATAQTPAPAAIMIDRKIVGGMGASGRTGERDSQVVQAGLKAQ